MGSERLLLGFGVFVCVEHFGPPRVICGVCNKTGYITGCEVWCIESMAWDESAGPYVLLILIIQVDMNVRISKSSIQCAELMMSNGGSEAATQHPSSRRHIHPCVPRSRPSFLGRSKEGLEELWWRNQERCEQTVQVTSVPRFAPTSSILGLSPFCGLRRPHYVKPGRETRPEEVTGGGILICALRGSALNSYHSLLMIDVVSGETTHNRHLPLMFRSVQAWDKS